MQENLIDHRCLHKDLLNGKWSSDQLMQSLNLRYEIFMDEVKPSDLSLSFLREFMELPISYFQPGTQIKFRKEHSPTYVNTDPLIMPTST